jgi:hypothetical protein
MLGIRVRSGLKLTAATIAARPIGSRDHKPAGEVGDDADAAQERGDDEDQS